MKKVSVIIPNYNNEKFVESCLMSVMGQDYPNKEVIVVDDGSTDDSVIKIREFISRNTEADMSIVCQDNLNAAMARNRGMELAHGDYVLFLDSDDMLEDGAISCLVAAKEKNEADLVIGNYEFISERGKVFDNWIFTDEDTVFDARERYDWLVSISPVPSNKLYDLKLIREKNVVWGNVRIGQDLDFYLKYLSCCKKVAMTNRDIYKYRICDKSMSRTRDLRIFDIVNVFSDVEKFYTNNGEKILYRRYIPVQALRHFGFQVEKQIFYKEYKTRRLIMEYFSVAERNLDYSLCEMKEYRKMRSRLRVRCALHFIFASGLYCKYEIKKRRKNVH